MLSLSLRTYLEQIEEKLLKNQSLLLLFKIRENINWDYPIDDEVISRLTRDNIIGRNYIDRSFKLLVPFYETDQAEFEIDIINTNTMLLDVDERIDEYRTLFKGYRVGNMGNKQNCISMLRRFIYEHKVEFNEILHATQYYIQNTDPKYITNAENFIYKIDPKGEISKLYDILEELRLTQKESNML